VRKRYAALWAATKRTNFCTMTLMSLARVNAEFLIANKSPITERKKAFTSRA